MINELITILSRNSVPDGHKFKKLWSIVKAISRKDMILFKSEVEIFNVLEAHFTHQEPKIRKLSMVVLCKLIKSNGSLYIYHHNIAPIDGKIILTQPIFLKESLSLNYLSSIEF